VAFDAGFPHTVMRHFAAEALAVLGQVLDPADRAAMHERLRKVNVSTIPAVKELRGRGDFYARRPKDCPEPCDRFRFEYDFEKYQVDGLARVFGASVWIVGDACHAWIRRWDPSISHMYHCPRRAARGEFGSGDHHGGSSPQCDRYGGYLARHALMLTAGEFLVTRPVTGDSRRDNPWSDWLAEHTLSRRDGLWLADGTDLFPVEMRHPVVAGSDADEGAVPLPVDMLALAQLAGLDERLALGETLIVDGDWNSTDKVDVTVSSVLTDEAEARVVAVALAAGEPFFQSLPREEGRFEWDEGDKACSIRPWIAAHDQVDQHLDRHDPYATPTALRRACLTDAAVAKLKIRSDDPFKRIWRDPGGANVLSAEAWGVTRGTGQYAWSFIGTRLGCRTDALQTLLASSRTGLVVLVKTQKYIEGKEGKAAFPTKTLVFWVDAHGVHPVLAIPRAVRKALGSLTQDEQTQLEPRLAVVRRYMTAAGRAAT
jgi:hypothetical protein